MSSGPASTPETSVAADTAASITDVRGESGPRREEDNCLRPLHLPCYVGLRIKTGFNMRRPACRVIATVKEADRRAQQEYSV